MFIYAFILILEKYNNHKNIKSNLSTSAYKFSIPSEKQCSFIIIWYTIIVLYSISFIHKFLDKRKYVFLYILFNLS